MSIREEPWVKRLIQYIKDNEEAGWKDLKKDSAALIAIFETDNRFDINALANGDIGLFYRNKKRTIASSPSPLAPKPRNMGSSKAMAPKEIQFASPPAKVTGKRSKRDQEEEEKSGAIPAVAPLPANKVFVSGLGPKSVTFTEKEGLLPTRTEEAPLGTMQWAADIAQDVDTLFEESVNKKNFRELRSSTHNNKRALKALQKEMLDNKASVESNNARLQGEIQKLSERLTGLEFQQRLEKQAPGSSPFATIDSLTTLQERIAALEQREQEEKAPVVVATPAPVSGSLPESVSQSLQQFEEKIKTMQGENKQLSSSVLRSTKATKSLLQEVVDQGNAMAARLNEHDRQFTLHENRLDSHQDQLVCCAVAVTNLGEEVTGLEKKVQKIEVLLPRLETKVDTMGDNIEKMLQLLQIKPPALASKRGPKKHDF